MTAQKTMTAHIEKREIGSLILENIPEVPKKLSTRLDNYHNTREAFVMDWLKDNDGLLIHTRFAEAAQLHIVKCQGGARKQLTFFGEPVSAARVCPHPDINGFLFAKDIGGNENHQLYFFDIEGGNYHLLTDGESKHGYGLWNREGTAIAYNSTKRNQSDHDIYIQNSPFEGKSEERLLLAEGGYWIPVDWSPGGSYLSALHFTSINECALYIIDTTNGNAIPIVSKEDVACRGGYWSNDGQFLYFASDEYDECRQLMRFDVLSSTMETIAIGIAAELETIRLSPDGKMLALGFNQDGYSRMAIWNVASKEIKYLKGLSKGVASHLRWKEDSQKLAFTINKAEAPADAYVLDLNDFSIVQWTHSEVGGLNTKSFVIPSLIHYPTFDHTKEGDRRHIPAYYYKPNKIADKPLPVLVYIHGGPESQYRPVFSSTFQYYLNELGIAVIAPNVRGSTGYGKSYLRLDDGYKREDSVKDIGELLNWIDQQPELDSNKVAVLGGSYGGYMVLASMTHYGHRLSCGIDVVGISNFVTFLENTKSYRRSLRRVEYGDERDPSMRKHLHQISPTTNAHKITKPMLIVQGLNDPRVPASEAEQMLKAIRENGGEAWYLLARDEGHGFRKKANRDFFNKAVILFLKQYLLEIKEICNDGV